jgi:uncharacterized membrane protein SirB2
MPSIGDYMAALAAWLRSTQLPEFSLWLQTQPISSAISNNFWVIPILQTIHILTVAGLFGSVVMINLRIFALAGRSRTMSQTVRRYLPWVWWGLLILLTTGIGMCIGEPTRELINPAFWTKMALVILAVLVSLGFQASVSRDVARWETTHGRRAGIRVAAVGVVLLWCAIMVLGRWIAYAPT